MIINKTVYYEKCEWCGALGPGRNTIREAENAADDEGWGTETVHGQEVFACPYCLKELLVFRNCSLEGIDVKKCLD